MMGQLPSLHAGDQIHCRLCGHWHRLEPGDPDGHPAGDKMPFMKCHMSRYFAGLIGAIATQPRPN
jgi:hypothetical protein